MIFHQYEECKCSVWYWELLSPIYFSRLLVASKDMEAELVCVDSYGKKAGMGVLDGGGFLFTVPLHTVRKLLNPDCVLLKTLGIDCFFLYVHALFNKF